MLALMRRRRTRISVAAPAKVNLDLRVVGRRDDGYHLIDSLMVPISLCDSLELTVRSSRDGHAHVRCRVIGPEKVAGGDGNLAARAARSVLAELGEPVEAAIRLRKVIPIGAGLGGGSSDAAAVLVALPRLLGRRIAAKRLADLAVALGADVPFFLACRPARVTGIGEKLAPLTCPAALNLVVVVPKRRIETAWAYANALPPIAVLATRPRRTLVAPRGLRTSAKSLSCSVSNDFEPGVAAAVPDVARLKQRLEALGAMATVMSGSGSAVVGVFASRRAAERAARGFRRPDKAWAVRTLLRRPRLDE